MKVGEHLADPCRLGTRKRGDDAVELNKLRGLILFDIARARARAARRSAIYTAV